MSLIRSGFLVLISFCTLLSQTSYYPNQILFDIRPQASALQIGSLSKDGVLVKNNQALNNLLKAIGAVKVERWLTSADETDVIDGVDLSKIYRVRLSNSYKPEELNDFIHQLKQISDVQFGSLEYKHMVTAARYIPNDPDLSRQWYMDKIMAPEAWALWGDSIPGSREILVGVVDSGFDYLHPDLQDVLYVNPGEDVDGDGQITAVDSNNVDDDGNGYVDDFHGWDFVGANKDIGQQPDNDVRPPQAGEGAGLSHGTHVAGVIAAQTDNNIGMSSISYRAKILVTKHAYDNALQYPFYIIDGYSGILYCAKMGADVINCSWGGTGGYSFYEKYVIKQASTTYGSIVVCAAGNDASNNDNKPHYPSDFEQSIAVAALSSGDERASFSNYGEVIDISAPGVGVYSTIHANAGSYASWSGTSMASPVVAGSFALLKAWYPDSSRDWLVDRLLSTADDIDNRNASYAGKLGSGRVNVYNAIASGFLPDLRIKDYVFINEGTEISSGLKPGDTVDVRVQIENNPLWRSAREVTVTLHAVEGKAGLIDSIAVIGDVASGDTLSNLSDEISLFILEDAVYEPIRIPVTVTAVTEDGAPYQKEQEIKVQLSLEADGFPAGGENINVPIALEDITDDGQKEIIAIEDNYYCTVIETDGSVLSGFPVSTGGYTTAPPIVADVDADGQPEIVIMDRSGLLRIFDSSGNMEKEIDTDERVYGNIAAANLDNDDDLEIIFGTMGREVHVIKPDSTGLAGFPYSVGGTIRYGIALADFTGDGIVELVFGSSDKKLHVITAQGDSVPGFPLDLPSRTIQTPVIGTTGEELQIYFVTNDDTLYQVSATGTVNWKYGLNTSVNAPLALEDVDNDGSLDVAVVCSDGTIHLVNSDGQAKNGFPYPVNEPISTSPVFADLNNDGLMEIALSSQTGYLYVLKAEGMMYPNFPALLDDQLNGSSAINDLDDDDRLEIATGGSNGVHLSKFTDTQGSNSYWMTAYGNNARTSNYSDGVTGLQRGEREKIASEFEVYQNYPNPFNPQTTIEYRIARPADVRLDIFNIVGERIVSVMETGLQPGRHAYVWNGANSNGRPVSSGLYVYKISIRMKNGQSFSTVKKMLLLK
ncbi:MAG TPA: hypothetical protein ENK44_07465 [Caldithrix abyssi]|uniref:Peptidase S8/S53 domain-containing protein n=1 Tax=Caldithrix abyssi TaxID=187145 RepID=A0A7V4WUS6_CALAY|nr:hypothetical protein [Caldithrix abyssi]